MNNNPLAAAIRNAFVRQVLAQPLSPTGESFARNSFENILRNKRICLFEQAVNRFLTNSGQRPVSGSSQFADEKNLLTFSLQLSGYIRDAQKALDKLSKDHACDPDLIALYRAAAKYSADCSGKIPGAKYVFKEHCDYRFWKIQNDTTLASARFQKQGFAVNPQKHNLFLSMPFHIRDSQEELQKWSSKFLNTALDNKNVFGSAVDVYLAHFPIEQPRGEKFALSLETIRSPQNYFEEADMRFVQKYWSTFLGTAIRTDKDNHVIGGRPFDSETFKQNCRNITVLGYCAGVAHAHRWINAFSHLASQIYDRSTVREAMQNIFVISYAFLPVQKENKYSGAHFMSNFADDKLRKEPFIKMFNPELYEQCKYRPQEGKPARISIMPDSRNYIIALNLPENFAVYNHNHHKQELPDIENGHHMGIVTHHNANSPSDYPFRQFTTVLENASLGRRGLSVFNRRENDRLPARHEPLTIVTFRSLKKPSSYLR